MFYNVFIFNLRRKNHLNTKRINTRIITMALCSIMSISAFVGCNGNNSESKSTATTQSEEQTSQEEIPSTATAVDNEELTRANYTKIAQQLKESYNQSPGDSATALEYAKTLFKLGDFDESQKVLESMLREEKFLAELTYLSAQLAYIKGNYVVAETLYKELKQKYFEEFGLIADAGLQMIYYQTNEYSKAKELFSGQEIDNPLLDMMKGFGEDKPYQQNWNNKKKAIIPFTTTELLPTIPIEINGVKINAIIDTGGPMLIVDERIASKLNFEPVSNGKEAGTGLAYGKTQSVRLGDVELQNVPTMQTSFKSFGDKFGPNMHAIIGSNVLQQFIPIIDGPSNQLTLIPRDEEGYKRFNKMLANEKIIDEVPFVRFETHYLFMKGFINDHKGLNFFVDSGFSNKEGSGMLFPKETMELLGIPMPELIPAPKEQSGLGGNNFEIGYFNVDSYGVGGLSLKSGLGQYRTEDVIGGLCNDLGFIGDALISHHYFKHYKWIIDSEAMTMTFCE